MSTENKEETSEYRDQLPSDLDITKAQAAYLLPSMRRRRGYAVASAVLGAALIALWATHKNGVMVNNALGILGGAMIALAIGVWFTGWDLAVREVQAIKNASASVKFPVGHIAAQLGWQGIRSRPTWRVLLYSHENPPQERAVVLVDGVSGSVVYSKAESNPEDWSTITA